jgi:TIR domain
LWRLRLFFLVRIPIGSPGQPRRGTSVADILISYSKPDRDKVVLLAAYLESEGWKVWWDNSLAIGDAYRDEIMKQLAAARAVIVLWTPTSVKSDFVRAEAGRAKADGKLIPVKDGVSYGDIPLPFGEMHTEDLTKRELIRAAVVAQLAKPAVQPSAMWVATRILRYQVLTWVGIVGGAITLFVNLDGLLTLAGWFHWLVSHWHEWMVGFWKWVFSWIGIKLPRDYVPLASFIVFSLMIGAGTRLNSGQSSGKVKSILIRLFLTLLIFSFLATAGYLLIISDGLFLLIFVLSEGSSAMVTLLFVLPFAMLVGLFRREWKSLAVFMFLFYIFSLVILVGPVISFSSSEDGPLPSNLPIIIGLFVGANVLQFAMLAMAPLPSIVRRLSFLAIGLALLVALNQLSVYAADIRLLLKPPV